MGFESWLGDNKDEIEQVQEFTKSDLPTVPQEIQADLNRTTRDFPRVGQWLADVERFVLALRSEYTLTVHCVYSDMPAAERKAIVDGMLVDVLHARDILKTTKSALDQRHFALLNQRNYAREEMRQTGANEG